MKSFDPTMRQQAADKLQAVLESLGVDRYKARQNAQSFIGGPSSNLPATMGLVDALAMLPGIGTAFGTAMLPMYVEEGALAIAEGIKSAEQGDFVSAGIETAVGALNVLPGAQAAKEVGTTVVKEAKTLIPKAAEMVVESAEKLGAPVRGLNIVESNKLKSNSEFINRDEFTAYMKQPKQLQGFKSSGINKPFDEQKYKHIEFVEVKLDDGSTFYDAIRGLNKTHAISRAFGNWSSADQIRTLSREQAQKVDPNLVKEVDSIMVAKEKK